MAGAGALLVRLRPSTNDAGSALKDGDRALYAATREIRTSTGACTPLASSSSGTPIRTRSTGGSAPGRRRVGRCDRWQGRRLGAGPLGDRPASAREPLLLAEPLRPRHQGQAQRHQATGGLPSDRPCVGSRTPASCPGPTRTCCSSQEERRTGSAPSHTWTGPRACRRSPGRQPAAVRAPVRLLGAARRQGPVQHLAQLQGAGIHQPHVRTLIKYCEVQGVPGKMVVGGHPLRRAMSAGRGGWLD